MLVIAILSYVVPLEEVLLHVDAHRAYLGTLHARGKLFASGPFVPRTGGALILRVDDEAEARAIVLADPFHTRNIATYAIHVWAPTLGADVLEKV